MNEPDEPQSLLALLRTLNPIEEDLRLSRLFPPNRSICECGPKVENWLK